ncbi:MAG: type II toxin-antitoxin system YafQ family toxin [Parachlamydiaceae bacterium]
MKKDIFKIIRPKGDLSYKAAKNRDPNVSGNWAHHRECHVRNDVLLIYKVEAGTLFLTRFGSHSDLF